MNETGTYEKRFGNIAIAKEFITAQQLIEALNLQVVEESRDGSHRLTGEVLFDFLYITTKQIEQVLSELHMGDGE